MTARVWRPDGPVWDQAPAGVRAVTDRTGRRWTKQHAHWTCDDGRYTRWWLLVAEHGPITETSHQETTR